MLCKRQYAFVLADVFLTFCVILPTSVCGHGRLIEPPSRASMWRYGYHTTPNYSDNQLFCGGFAVQWNINKGKCGVCGDPWQGPREHEAGGKYATGIIVRRYDVGSTITVIVQITASHLGYFEFRLCPVNNPKIAATWQCLNKYLLQLADGSGTRYYVTRHGPFNYQINLKLPPGLNCTQCVLQWKYNAGNSWGIDANGKGCRGCGAQEQFYGCSDIAIGDNSFLLPASPNIITTATQYPVAATTSPVTATTSQVAATTTTSPATSTTTDQWQYNWLFLPRLNDEKMDVNSDEWFSGNLNLTIINQEEKTSPISGRKTDIKQTVDDRHPVTDNDKKSSDTRLLTNKISVYDNDPLSIMLRPAINAPDMGLPRSNRKIESYNIVEDVPDPYSYFDEASSGLEDYDYLDILRSLIGTLQSRLNEVRRAKSSAPPDISSKRIRSRENETNDVQIQHNNRSGRSKHKYPDIQRRNDPRKMPSQDRVSDKTDSKGDKEKRTETTVIRKYNLVEMLKLSGRSSTVRP
ncbi:hypothetical protein LSH36_53g07025 [Paralvinella palmiformis]|uniref:Chitin-binding type-4 domain-containing protein n=1 Tax=Paralvinella palmiformis TaxID=53620 RepID=A0AAD9K750_9ANNE|nr:hypothetical protein LSH36_53g07025 [Paralvinella palmiformis]